MAQTLISNSAARDGDARPPAARGESGMTLLEVTIAMLLLLVGLLAAAGAVAYGLSASNQSRNVTRAKQMAVATLEQIQTLRNTQQLAFKQIANVGAVDNSGLTYQFVGFPTEFRSVSPNPGNDGIFGTGDDLSIAAGGDGIWGTADDTTNESLVRLEDRNYSRSITISNIGGNSNLRKIVVTIRYPGQNGAMQTISATGYLHNDAQKGYI